MRWRPVCKSWPRRRDKVPFLHFVNGSRTLFVTGTDTGVGKTRVAAALIRQARRKHTKVCGWKPVATGCAATPDGLRNDDALALEDAAASGEPYELLNPYAFAPAVAPHLAAQLSGRRIRVAELDRIHAQLAQRHGLVVAEGAGGWRVPLDDSWTLGAWVAEHEWPVLLVVGMRLGCLNHALLSAEAIARDTKLVGWVANVPAPMPLLEENLATLGQRLSVPCWGRVSCGAADFDVPARVAEALDALPGPSAPDDRD
jgi:dethiobiotin synthetase